MKLIAQTTDDLNHVVTCLLGLIPRQVLCGWTVWARTVSGASVAALLRWVIRGSRFEKWGEPSSFSPVFLRGSSVASVDQSKIQNPESKIASGIFFAYPNL
jgi:hypothetical protein